jgi:predicted permease
MPIGGAQQAAIVEEIAHDLEARYDAFLREGVEGPIAVEQVLAELDRGGGLAQHLGRVVPLASHMTSSEERESKAKLWLGVETILRDVRYALRGLRRHPGTSALALAALAIGIAVNATVFTGRKAIFDRPLDARHPNEMVNIAIRDRSGATAYTFSDHDYETYRDAARSFSGLVAYRLERMTVAGLDRLAASDAAAASSAADRSEFTNTAEVSDNYFAVLGISMLHGRAFGLADTLHDAPPVLISENYWQRRLGAAPSVVGATIRLNGVSVVVIGITPPDFEGTAMSVPNFWLPMSATPIVHGDDEWLRAHDAARYRLFGRLAPRVDRMQAQAELTVLANRLRQTRTGGMDDAQAVRAVVWPGSPFPLPLSDYTGLTIAVRLILLAAALVLIVACANVGALQLARAQSRQVELQARVALGASRRRILQQLLTESLVMSLLAGAIALLFTWGLLEITLIVVGRTLPVEYAFAFDVSPDLRIFAYVFGASALAGLMFGAAPAIESARAALTPAVRGSTTAARSRRLHDALVATQVALSLALLVVGGVVIHGAMRMATRAPGYDSTHVVDVEMQFADGARYSSARKQAVMREVQRRVEALPGVEHVTSATPPTDGGAEGRVVPIENTVTATASRVHYRQVGADYFSALGIPVLRGRGLPQTRSATGAAVLSQSAAETLWPAQDAVGRVFRLQSARGRSDEGSASAPGAIYQVVGVVGDTQGPAIDGTDAEQIYLELPDSLTVEPSLLVRTAADASRMIHAIDTAISGVDPNLVVTLATLEEIRRLSPPVFVSATSATVASVVGVFGLLLTLMGIHSTVRYVVARRTREVGIRMTLGAQRSDVLRLILYEGTRPVLIGLVVGVSMAIALTALLSRVIYGLAAFDGISIAAVSALFLMISTLAAYLPARRALRVDPNVALRSE